MDYGDLENQQFADFINNQNPVVENILRNAASQQNYNLQQNVDWRIVLAAKDMLEDNSTYRLPLGFTLMSLVRIILTLMALSYSKDRSQFIQVFTSVGLFKDLLQMLYNYMLIRSIQKIKKLLFLRLFDDTLIQFLAELQDKNFSTKYKSSLIIGCILKTDSFLRLFGRILKGISWALFFYVIYMLGVSKGDNRISGISIPLIILFTIGHFCILAFTFIFFIYNTITNMSVQLRDAYIIIQQKYLKYKLSQFIERLPCTLYENIKEKENITSCAVCLVDYSVSDYVLQLSCSTQHHFHKACIKQWLDIKQNCPICRSAVFDLSKPCHNPTASSLNNTQSAQEQSIQTQQSVEQIENVQTSPEFGTQRQNPCSQREKSNSLPSISSSSQDNERNNQIKLNQQFYQDLKNKVPNKQIIEMIEENLSCSFELRSEQQIDIKEGINSESYLKDN